MQSTLPSYQRSDCPLTVEDYASLCPADLWGLNVFDCSTPCPYTQDCQDLARLLRERRVPKDHSEFWDDTTVDPS